MSDPHRFIFYYLIAAVNDYDGDDRAAMLNSYFECNIGEEELAKYLMQWDSGDNYGEPVMYEPWGSGDKVLYRDDNYVLACNPDIAYCNLYAIKRYHPNELTDTELANAIKYQQPDEVLCNESNTHAVRPH